MVRGEQELAALRALYAAAAEAEQAAADELVPGGVLSDGDPLARVLLVKGEPGPADLEAGEALAGADGDAARAALEALGAPLEGGVLAVVSRPAPGVDPGAAAERLARYLESADPAVAIALDAVAAQDLAAAAGVRALPFGEPVRAHGRVLLAVDGLEASLRDEVRKKRVWGQLKALKRE